MATIGIGGNPSVIITDTIRGVSRTTETHEAHSGRAWGSDIPDGRFVVASPEYAARLASGDSNSVTVSLADATGDYVKNPKTGLFLKDEPDTLALYKAFNGDYHVLGVAHRGQHCTTDACQMPQPFPVGNKEESIYWQIAHDSESLAVGFHGYYMVEVAEDVEVGMTSADLTITDVPTYDATDPTIEVAGLSALAAGGGAIPIPAGMNIKVTKGAKAGGTAEIYLGA